jgi:hypothetical protein
MDGVICTAMGLGMGHTGTGTGYLMVEGGMRDSRGTA